MLLFALNFIFMVSLCFFPFLFFLFMRLVFVKFDNIGDAYRDGFRDSRTKLEGTYSKFIDSSRKRCRGKSSGKSSRKIFDLMLVFHFVSWKNNMRRSHGHRSPSSSSWTLKIMAVESLLLKHSPSEARRSFTNISKLNFRTRVSSDVTCREIVRDGQTQ